MNIILLIFALECGISDDVVFNNTPQETLFYCQAETGLKMNDLYLVIYGNVSTLNDNDWQNLNYGVKMYVDTKNIEFGFTYNYDYSNNDDRLKIYARLQSW